MTLDQLRSLRDAVPFQPFTIHLAGGRSFPIPHRDFLSISPSGRTVIAYQTGDVFSFLDLRLVTELSVEGQSVGPAPADGAA